MRLHVIQEFRLNSTDLEATRNPVLEEAFGVIFLRNSSDVLHIGFSVTSNCILPRIRIWKVPELSVAANRLGEVLNSLVRGCNLLVNPRVELLAV